MFEKCALVALRKIVGQTTDDGTLADVGRLTNICKNINY
jgi:hypothetical protein